MSLAQPTPRPWTAEEYFRLGETGLVGPEERLELIEGEILEMSPQNSDHAVATDLALVELGRAFGQGFYVRDQKPLELGLRSVPEPDVCVMRGRVRDFARHHPTAAVLVVEVADSSLAYDLGRKAEMYASASVPEYWVVALPERRLIVHRDPLPEERRFATCQSYAAGDTVTPLAASDPIRVAELLP